MGRYRLVRSLRCGGTSEVFEAYLESDFGFRRRLALKRPKPGATLDVLTATADEAFILSELEHPGVVSILDFGVDNGLPYQTLEYIDGFDLEDLRRRIGVHGDHSQSVPATHVLRLIADAALALDYVHRAHDREGRPMHIVHRDLCPRNILVSRHGQTKIIDFGIALAEVRRTRTVAGVVKGNRLFMAPEQTDRKPIDARTDVFSLGCVMHYLLTGQSPIVPNEERVLGGLTKLAARLDDDLSLIVLTAIRRLPDDRFASAGAMASACLQCLHARGGMDHDEFARWLSSLPDAPKKPTAVDDTREMPAPRVQVLGTGGLRRPQEPAPGMNRPSPPVESTGDDTIMGTLASPVAPVEDVRAFNPVDPAPAERPSTRIDSGTDPHEERTIMPDHVDLSTPLPVVTPVSEGDSRDPFESSPPSERPRDGSTMEMPAEDEQSPSNPARGLRWPP